MVSSAYRYSPELALQITKRVCRVNIMPLQQCATRALPCLAPLPRSHAQRNRQRFPGQFDTLYEFMAGKAMNGDCKSIPVSRAGTKADPGHTVQRLSCIDRLKSPWAATCKLRASGYGAATARF